MLHGALLWLSGNITEIGESEPRWGCCWLTEKSRKTGPWRWFRGLALDKLLLPTALRVASLRGEPQNLGRKGEDAHLRKKGVDMLWRAHLSPFLIGTFDNFSIKQSFI